MSFVFLRVRTLAFGTVFLAAACGSSSKDDLFGGGVIGPPPGGQSNGGGGGGSGGGGMGNGAGGLQGPLCTVPQQCKVPSGAVPCCTNDFKCGVRVGHALPYQCVTPDPGKGVNQGCPTAFILGGTGYGCCRSNDTCGYTDPDKVLGCIDPAQLDLAPGKPCPQ